MENIRSYIQNSLLNKPSLADYRNEIGIVLSGSRAVNYHSPSSDYDFLGLCSSETYTSIAALAGKAAPAGGIDICVNEQASELGDNAQVDMTLFKKELVEQAFRNHNDIVIWIWTNAKIIVDTRDSVQSLKCSFDGYPRDILEQKLKYHWLRDFDLSVHSMTYHAESQNLFSVVFALTSKIAQFCKLCCLLDGNPFPYDKWLLRACQETKLGQCLSPIFERVLGALTRLDGDVSKNWGMVQEAIDAIDTEACDIMEEALVAWGIDREWLDNSYNELTYMLFQ